MMPRYKAYKDSGIEWIGEIPEHWEAYRFSSVGHFFKGIGIKKDEVKSTGSPCIRYGEIYTAYDRIVYSPVSFISEETTINSVKGIKGDILIAGSGETIEDIGRAILYYGETTIYVGGDIIVLRLRNIINALFLSYVVNAPYVQYHKSLVGKGEIIVHIYAKDIKVIRFVLPPPEEQTQIVQYLDKKTSLIDELISLKERKIELLKEKRTALINHVVTKGLNPNVKMKDSGIEWIGEIPEHWEVKKMKYAVFHSTEKALPPTDAIKISPENVESNTGKCLNYRSEYEGEGYSFTKGDLLLNKLRIYLKKILFAELDGFSMGEMLVLRCKSTLYNRYFYYLLFNQGLIDFLDAQSTGIKMPRVSPEIILNTRIIYPPKSEQTQIVKYLDKKTKKIDNQLTLEQKKIDLLKEYRQSLISEVVTGKIKVTKD
jgi:type I restriction enzyme S subunit